MKEAAGTAEAQPPAEGVTASEIVARPAIEQSEAQVAKEAQQREATAGDPDQTVAKPEVQVARTEPKSEQPAKEQAPAVAETKVPPRPEVVEPQARAAVARAEESRAPEEDVAEAQVEDRGGSGTIRAAGGSLAIEAAGQESGDEGEHASRSGGRGAGTGAGTGTVTEAASGEATAPADAAAAERVEQRAQAAHESAGTRSEPKSAKAPATEQREAPDSTETARDAQREEEASQKREALAMRVPAEEALAVPAPVGTPSPAAEPSAVDPARVEQLRAVQEELRRVQALLERLANETGPSAQAQIAEALVSLTAAEHRLQDLQAETRPEPSQPIVIAPEGAGAGEEEGAPSLEGDSDLRMLVQVRVNEVSRMVGPLAARRAGRGGAALVRVRIDPRGYVEEVEFLQSTGSKALDEEVDVILHLGEPYLGVRGWVRVAVRFDLPDS